HVRGIRDVEERRAEERPVVEAHARLDRVLAALAFEDEGQVALLGCRLETYEDPGAEERVRLSRIEAARIEVEPRLVAALQVGPVVLGIDAGGVVDERPQ